MFYNLLEMTYNKCTLIHIWTKGISSKICHPLNCLKFCTVVSKKVYQSQLKTEISQ